MLKMDPFLVLLFASVVTIVVCKKTSSKNKALTRSMKTNQQTMQVGYETSCIVSTHCHHPAVFSTSGATVLGCPNKVHNTCTLAKEPSSCTFLWPDFCSHSINVAFTLTT